MTIEDKIREIEEEIRKTQYNKATQHHIGKLKAKISRLRESARVVEESKKASKGKGGYSVKKSGDATVILVGLPSVGKSTLLNKLTNANSKVASYAFTTTEVEPGILEYKGARIQILDIPGMIEGASIGKGRGKEILSVIRSADLLLLLVDVFNVRQLDILKKEVYNAGVRMDAKPPDVRIKVRDKGGINISSTVKLTKLDEETVKGILQEYGHHNADVVIREDVSIDEFIDSMARNRVYLRSLVVLNKVDLVNENFLREASRQLKTDFLAISAASGHKLDELRRAIYGKLNFIRVYLKPHGGEPDMKEPIIVVRGTTVGNICDRLHTGLRDEFRYARVWGTSAKFNGHRVGLGHALNDEDVVTIVSG